MAAVHRFRSWDVDRREATPLSSYLDRRSFIKSIGAGGLAAMGLPGSVAAWTEGDEALRATLVPPAGSAFSAPARNARYTVERPLTEESVSARYNNFYEFGLDKERCWRAAQKLTVRPWAVQIDGLVAKPQTIAIDDLIRKMPCEERLYRFRCVERWAMVVPWSGFPFSALMSLVEPLAAAKYVRFVSFHRPEEAVGQRPGSGWRWPYYEGLTMAEATHELCFVATGLYGHDIPRQHGAPLRMVVPWKYGYKGAKSVVRIEFVDRQPGTFWNDHAAHEYGFYSNVNPKKPHPRWPQTHETMIGKNKRHETQPYNGYGDLVAGLYKGNEH